MTYRLQPLRIPIGWTVAYNDFHEVDQSDPEAWRWRKDTLLQLKHVRRDRLLDLSWHPPDDSHGCYRVLLFAGDFTGTELEAFESRDRLEIVAVIEGLLESV
ncbi:MAG: hypothetical protein AB7P07_08790 [Hyphomonadaceae bacterium]